MLVPTSTWYAVGNANRNYAEHDCVNNMNKKDWGLVMEAEKARMNFLLTDILFITKGLHYSLPKKRKEVKTWIKSSRN